MDVERNDAGGCLERDTQPQSAFKKDENRTSNVRRCGSSGYGSTHVCRVYESRTAEPPVLDLFRAVELTAGICATCSRGGESHCQAHPTCYLGKPSRNPGVTSADRPRFAERKGRLRGQSPCGRAGQVLCPALGGWIGGAMRSPSVPYRPRSRRGRIHRGRRR